MVAQYILSLFTWHHLNMLGTTGAKSIVATGCDAMMTPTWKAVAS